MSPNDVKLALDKWVRELNPNDKQYRHHQVEAMWIYRNLELVNTELIKELLKNVIITTLMLQLQNN